MRVAILCTSGGCWRTRHSTTKRQPTAYPLRPAPVSPRPSPWSGHALLDLGRPSSRRPSLPARVSARSRPRVRDAALRPARPRGAREQVEVDCPEDERARLAGSGPAHGRQRVRRRHWIAARWADLNRALADEIRRSRARSRTGWSARHPSWHVVGKVCLHLAENSLKTRSIRSLHRDHTRRAPARRKVQHRPLHARSRSPPRATTGSGCSICLHRSARSGADRWLAELIDLRRNLPGVGLDARPGSPLPERHPGLRGGRTGRARPRLVARRAPTTAGSGRARRREEAKCGRDGRAARLFGGRRAVCREADERGGVPAPASSSGLCGYAAKWGRARRASGLERSALTTGEPRAA